VLVRSTLALLALVSLVAAPGCRTDDIGWFVRQGIGQAEVLAGARDVSRVLRNPATPPKVKHRLRLVDAARRFARDELGLDVSHQYRTVTFLDSPAVVFIVSASPRTELAAYRWEYPVLGALPYRGYFSLEEAEAEAEKMAGRGYDVDVGAVPTYSLLGVLPDPIVSPMLFSSDQAWLVETVIHELAHATVFAPGQGAFNEGLATFIGREGRRRFVEKHYGDRSAIYEWTQRYDADRKTYARAVGALAFDLRVLFAQAADLPEREILARKDEIFLQHQRHFRAEVADTLLTHRVRRRRLPDNNADLSVYGLYTLQQHLYARTYAACNEDMGCLIRMLRAVASEPDPETSLAERLRGTRRRERVIR
jgi:predicted aminopeptidase